MSARSFSTEGRALRAGSPQRLSPQLYPQIKKKKKKKPQHSHHSHLQPSCAYYYYFRNNLFNKNSCVSSPSPASWALRPLLTIISIIKMICGPGSAQQPFPALARLGSGSPPRKRVGAWRGVHRWGSERGASLLPASWPSPQYGGKGALATTTLSQGSRIFPPPLGL